MTGMAFREAFLEEWATGGFFNKARLRSFDREGGERVLKKLDDLHRADLTKLDGWERLRIGAVIWERPSLAAVYKAHCIRYGGADNVSYTRLAREMDRFTRQVIDRLAGETEAPKVVG